MYTAIMFVNVVIEIIRICI